MKMCGGCSLKCDLYYAASIPPPAEPVKTEHLAVAVARDASWIANSWPGGRGWEEAEGGEGVGKEPGLFPVVWQWQEGGEVLCLLWSGQEPVQYVLSLLQLGPISRALGSD